MSNQAMSKTDNSTSEYSVSQISNLIKTNLEDNFSYIKIKGEISGLKPAPSGHVYFSLKDDKAVIAAICWRGTISKLQFKLEEGMEMVCYGSITTYPLQSKYQFIVTDVKPAGVGALMALLEKRKKQLASEGIFDQQYKKSIAKYPSIIGVITSPTGSVIRDILHRISERFPLHVLIWPVLVQGEKAAEQITDAINGFNNLHIKPDTIIVARGGGSIEDLWCFNEENVARAAFASAIPIISAIGHETDFTLLDFVADLRAPTPTAAAELAVPIRMEIAKILRTNEHRANSAIVNMVNHHSKTLSTLKIMSPLQLLLKMQANLRVYNNSLDNNIAINVRSQQNRLSVISRVHRIEPIINNIKLSKNKLDEYKVRLARVITDSLQQKSKSINFIGGLLSSYHYHNVLSRGFAVLRDESGKLITSKLQIEDNKIYELELADGTRNMKAI
jgi:exodeoxyribonuclease VII large subunit